MATRMSDQVRAYCIDKGFSGKIDFGSENANVLLEEDKGTYVIKHWSVDGVAKPTIETLNTYAAAGKALEQEIIDFENSKADLKASAKTKLKKLGLTDDEIKATLGV